MRRPLAMIRAHLFRVARIEAEAPSTGQKFHRRRPALCRSLVPAERCLAPLLSMGSSRLRKRNPLRPAIRDRKGLTEGQKRPRLEREDQSGRLARQNAVTERGSRHVVRKRETLGAKVLPP